jgi:hypothetical protein
MPLLRVLHLPARGGEPKPCRCGHASGAHEHYRRGSDCALCSCPKYRTGSRAKQQRQGARGERAHAA